VNVAVGPDGDGDERKSVVDDPDQTYKKIHRLRPNTTYSMTIVAQTDAGPGPEVAVIASTVPVSGMITLTALVDVSLQQLSAFTCQFVFQCNLRGGGCKDCTLPTMLQLTGLKEWL